MPWSGTVTSANANAQKDSARCPTSLPLFRLRSEDGAHSATSRFCEACEPGSGDGALDGAWRLLRKRPADFTPQEQHDFGVPATPRWHWRPGARAKRSEAASPEASAAAGIKNRKGLELPRLARSLVIPPPGRGCRRHGTPGPEAEDLITHSDGRSRGPAPAPTGPGDTCTHRGACYGTPYVCGNPRFATGVSKHAASLLQSRPLSPPPEAASKPAPRSGRRCCLCLPGLRPDLFSRVKIKGKTGRRGPIPGREAGFAPVWRGATGRLRRGRSCAASAEFLNFSRSVLSSRKWG